MCCQLNIYKDVHNVSCEVLSLVGAYETKPNMFLSITSVYLIGEMSS
jgi:hypothetical protein